VLDGRIFKHFTYYIAKTQVAIAEIGLVLEGDRPAFEPELNNLDEEKMQDRRNECLSHLKAQRKVPIDYFSTEFTAYIANDSAAMRPPIKAPASTSLG
jgi:hypothetical protein